MEPGRGEGGWGGLPGWTFEQVGRGAMLGFRTGGWVVGRRVGNRPESPGSEARCPGGPWGVALQDLGAGNITGHRRQGGGTCAAWEGCGGRSRAVGRLPCVATIYVHLLSVGMCIRWLSLHLGDGSDFPEGNGELGPT